MGNGLETHVPEIFLSEMSFYVSDIDISEVLALQVQLCTEVLVMYFWSVRASV